MTHIEGGGAPFPGRAFALLPVAYLLHVAEEAACGEGFPAWASRSSGIDLRPGPWLALNAVFMTLMIAGLVAARRAPRAAALAPALATTTLVNAFAHLAATLWTGAYSPGLWTGLLLWVPLDLFLLRAVRRDRPGLLRLGVVIGVAMHAAVTGAALAVA